MKLFTKQKNKISSRNKGFTLVETLVAIFILVVALNGFFALTTSSLFSARYARNEITANYLMQEAVDYIRNDRDTYAFQKMADVDGGWTNFLNRFGYPNQKCFAGSIISENGCEIEATDLNPANISTCQTPSGGTFGSTNCRRLNYDESASNKNFYTYNGGVESQFKRQVLMYIDGSGPNGQDEVNIRVTVEWLNGSIVRSRYLQVALLNWQQ